MPNLDRMTGSRTARAFVVLVALQRLGYASKVKSGSRTSVGSKSIGTGGRNRTNDLLIHNQAL